MENMRRIERERVLALLYEADMKEQPIAEVLAELPVRPEDFVVEIIEGVDANTAQLDKLIEQFAIDWKTERMASIDRIVLRIGTWELINQPELPIAVIISEAIELAKRFSTDESGKFVNGILASIAASERN